MSGRDDLVDVTFVWRGEAERTSVGWGAQRSLEKIKGTDIWVRTLRMPAAMRTIYYISHYDPAEHHTPPDVSGAGMSHVDPLNPGHLLFPGDPLDPTDRDGWVSVLTMPGAPPDRWSLPQPGIPAGTVEQTTLDGGHRIAVYRPPGDHRRGELRGLVVFDGYQGRTMMRMPTTIDNLIAAGRVPPLVALFVDGNDETRLADLAPSSERTASFVTGELMRFARAEHGVSARPRDNALAGMSIGGLAAASIAVRSPDVFGGAIAHSGSFWWPHPQDGTPQWLVREVLRRPRADLRFYLDVGSGETRVFSPGVADQLTVNRRLRDALRSKGYPVTYAEYRGEHDYVNWRVTFADGLVAMFGEGAAR